MCGRPSRPHIPHPVLLRKYLKFMEEPQLEYIHSNCELLPNF